MCITCILAYIAATFIIEAVSVANSVVTETTSLKRQDIFQEEVVKLQANSLDPDVTVKSSKYFIREKLEIGTIIERVGEPLAKTVFITVLIIYVYGALSLKYVAGSESFYQGISFLIWGNETSIERYIPGAYYWSIAIFGTLSCAFSFGDIENSKDLQVFAVFSRFVCVSLMLVGTLYYWGASGLMTKQVWDPET